MNKQIPILIFLCLISVTASAVEEKSFISAPSQLPDTTPQMNTAGYWIGLHSSPDQEILSADGIKIFNMHVQRDLKLTKDIFERTAHFKTESLVDIFEKTIKEFADKGLYTYAGARDTQEYLDKCRRNMNLGGVILGVQTRYGLIRHLAPVRFFPTTEGLYESNGDFDFDQVQNSSLDIGTPVAIVHQSADKKWVYVFTALADGWIPADDVAVGDMKTVREYANHEPFVVITTPKADIYLDNARRVFDGNVRMGSRLPLVKQENGMFEVLVPIVDKDKKLAVVPGCLNQESAHEGLLPYTPRVILNQAFIMLNQPYGWGGVRGEQDCSALMDQVFATVGIILPRDSKDQAQVGQALAEFDDQTTIDTKLTAFKDVVPGSIVLPMKGHIMLYVGEVNDKPYVIQAIWAYREKKGDRDVPRVVNRVVVSSLFLGEGSRKGSLLKRLTKIVSLK